MPSAVAFCLFILNLPCLLHAQPADSIPLAAAKKKYHAGDINGALAGYSEIIKANPKNEDAFYERGRIYNQQKRYLDAINDFTKVTELNPKNHRAYYLRGYTKFLTGNYRGAADDLNKSIEIYPNSALAFWYRAEVRMRLGDKAGACGDWDKAYRLGYFEATGKIRANCEGAQVSTEVAADEYLRKGDEKLDKGDASGALAEYLKAEGLNPESGMIAYSIGLAKIILKDINGACQAWKKAESLGSPESQEMLRQHCN